MEGVDQVEGGRDGPRVGTGWAQRTGWWWWGGGHQTVRM